jgi:hypothetical protein
VSKTLKKKPGQKKRNPDVPDRPASSRWAGAPINQAQRNSHFATRRTRVCVFVPFCETFVLFRICRIRSLLRGGPLAPFLLYSSFAYLL